MKIAIYLTPAQARLLVRLPTVTTLNQSSQLNQMQLGDIANSAQKAVNSLESRVMAAEHLLSRYREDAE